ncbi:MAG: hypothetical protein M3347_00340 [Armatimonadota bacterium]|nr:hypothetical protein [Armatimonadota bacterium]
MHVSEILIFAGAIALGAVHAFEVDHMAAVSAFVANKPTPRQATLFGIKWAMGHSISLLLLGSILFAVKLTISAPVETSLEKLVGVALFALGCWTLWQVRPRQGRPQRQQIRLVEEPADGDMPLFVQPGSKATRVRIVLPTDKHQHSLWMGILHGAAGTAAFAGQTLLAVSQTYLMVFVYTLAFSIGVLLAMAAYAGALGSLVCWGERRYALVAHGAHLLTGVWACGVGLWWVFK